MARPGFANRDDLLRWADTVTARTEFPPSHPAACMGDGTGCSPARLPRGIGDLVWRLGRLGSRYRGERLRTGRPIGMGALR